MLPRLGWFRLRFWGESFTLHLNKLTYNYLAELTHASREGGEPSPENDDNEAK